MRFTYLWFIVGIAAIAFGAVRLATQAAGEWALPVLAGGVACLVAGAYQLWWERSVFEEPDPRAGRFPVWRR